MNGSIVYELERPENAGLKKPMKACSPTQLFTYRQTYIVDLYVSMQLLVMIFNRKLIVLYFLNVNMKMINFHTVSDQLIPSVLALFFRF